VTSNERSGVVEASAERARTSGGELSDARVAVLAAATTGDVLLALRLEVDGGRFRGDAAGLRKAADAAAQAHLARLLAELRPADAVLSEEAQDSGDRLTAERVWIVDPLDGTREFAERHANGEWRDDFAVHVALWRRGAGLTDAAVALPALGRVHATDDGRRVAAGDDQANAAERPLRVVASRTRAPEIVCRLAARDDVEVILMGSTGAKAMAVLEGDADGYVHAGGQFEGDSAAPVAVAVAAGLVATRLDGSDLEYNRPDPRLPDLVICRPAYARRLRALLAEAGARA
jgi:3'(2'), 5'-bisphosphate nucleotidase